MCVILTSSSSSLSLSVLLHSQVHNFFRFRASISLPYIHQLADLGSHFRWLADLGLHFHWLADQGLHFR